MERQAKQAPSRAEGWGFWESRGWLLVLAGLTIWQAWLTLGLFGQERPWLALLDEQPIISGRHALHLYHGWLGAQAFSDRGRTLAYDPSFHAGYPKTALFDSGSKPAELFLWVGGSAYHPVAYKLGLAIFWCLIPLLLFTAGRTGGLGHGGSCLVAFLSMMVCWSDFGRELLWAGDLDFLLASCLMVLTIGLLNYYHTQPHSLSWLILTAACWGVCFSQVLLFVTLIPVAFVFYFQTGAQHRVGWHLGLFAALAVAVAGNWFWLRDLLDFWWVQAEGFSIASRGSFTAGLALIWQNPLWKDSLHRGFALALLAGSLVGMVLQWRGPERVAARTLGFAALAYLALGLLGPSWSLLDHFEPARFLVPALLCAAIPTGQVVLVGFTAAGRVTGGPLRGAALAVSVLLIAGIILHESLGAFAGHCLRREPLPIGLPVEAQVTVDTLQQYTTAEARILWEETPKTDIWSPLLPVLTQRAYLGGLGPSANIEHGSLRLAEGSLAGRALDEWSDKELGEYCRRYNIGWVVCRSPAVVDRFQNWSGAAFLAELSDGGRLFAVAGPHSYFLKGHGRIVRCDSKVLTLTDLEPVDGQVVLSFHYHANAIPSTDRVRVEKEPQLHDAVPFIRLRVPGPMSRLTLYWQE